MNLAESYHASGNSHAARDTWRSALAILTDLGHPDAEQVQGRLRTSNEGGLDLPDVSASPDP